MGFHMFPSVPVIIFILHGSSYSHKDKGFYGFMKDATSAPTYARFDYIVIGGGTSGCSLAATLSQNASVLVLERGGSPYDNPRATDIENVANTLLNITPNSWSQPFISEDGVYNTRARVLGGDSVLNAGFYSRAEEYYVKEAEWEMEEVEAAYEWVERKLVFEPQVTGWQSALKDGLLEAGVLPYNGFTFKHIIGTKIGGSTFDSAGHKHSAADLLEYANPDKIAVYLHATVHKILFTTKGNQRPKAYGMIYQDADGMFHKVELAENAMNEVILSAGALGSPQLLMLSGVGPRAHLEAQGVDPVVIDHPMVGQGMGDNPMNSVIVPSPQPVELSLPQVVGITRFGNFIEGFSGLSLSYNLTRMFFETRLSTQSITSFINSSDFQLNLIEIDGVIFQKVDGPFSRGYLELRNTNPDDNPSVTFNYYQEPEDLEKCVKGLETIIEVINSNAFSKYKYLNATGRELLNRMLGLPTNLRPRHVTSVFNLRQFCIDTVMSVWHYHGGCQVGRVVDKDYKVLGIDALRVIDGSTFLKSPGTNPQATVMMLGRSWGRRFFEREMLPGKKGTNRSLKMRPIYTLHCPNKRLLCY
ncbi:protein HOTHEAD-like isoform X1 [Brassica rapa]|uniref:protein HOTHEAD-like isoform X1 n=1 Tax=Brassica campestris TaxID=3711 RepID=UPI00142D25C1|nr:protein HOTHEAD-like isoform X1 [Brassica rapa]